MSRGLKTLVLTCSALAWFIGGLSAFVPAAKAQFFWSPWFDDRPRASRRAPEPEPILPSPRDDMLPPSDDLPPIEPQAELPPPPPPPDDRPYDEKLLRLAEILGALHYLRELCGAQEGQLWRKQMEEIVKTEGSTAVRRARLVNSFNDGYRGFRRTYRSCTDSATVAIDRFTEEGSTIAVALATPSEPRDKAEATSGDEPREKAEAAPAGEAELEAPAR